MRGMPFYFARFGPAEAAYVDTFCLDPINGDAQRAFGSELPGLDLRSRLANITAPTLVITGEDDFICGPVCADEISAAIRGSREVIVPDAGHMLVFEQRRIFQMIARLPEMHRQLRELTAQIAVLTDAFPLHHDAHSLSGDYRVDDPVPPTLPDGPLAG